MSRCWGWTFLYRAITPIPHTSIEKRAKWREGTQRGLQGRRSLPFSKHLDCTLETILHLWARILAQLIQKGFASMGSGSGLGNVVLAQEWREMNWEEWTQPKKDWLCCKNKADLLKSAKNSILCLCLWRRATPTGCRHCPVCPSQSGGPGTPGYACADPAWCYGTPVLCESGRCGNRGHKSPGGTPALQVGE